MAHFGVAHGRMVHSRGPRLIRLTNGIRLRHLAVKARRCDCLADKGKQQHNGE